MFCDATSKTEVAAPAKATDPKDCKTHNSNTVCGRVGEVHLPLGGAFVEAGDGLPL